MAWKFLTIPKANAEIDRLRKENEELKAKAAAVPAAAPVAQDDGMVECDACNGTGACAECSGAGKCTECAGSGKVEAKAIGQNKGALAKARASLDDANSSLEKASQQVASLQQTLTSKDAEIKSLTERLAAKDSEVNALVARKVQAEQAALGQPPVAASPKEATNGKEKSGLSRVLSACKSDLDAAGYVRKTN